MEEYRCLFVSLHHELSDRQTPSISPQRGIRPTRWRLELEKRAKSLRAPVSRGGRQGTDSTALGHIRPHSRASVLYPLIHHPQLYLRLAILTLLCAYL